MVNTPYLLSYNKVYVVYFTPTTLSFFHLGNGSLLTFAAGLGQRLCFFLLIFPIIAPFLKRLFPPIVTRVCTMVVRHLFRMTPIWPIKWAIWSKHSFIPYCELPALQHLRSISGIRCQVSCEPERSWQPANFTKLHGLRLIWDSTLTVTFASQPTFTRGVGISSSVGTVHRVATITMGLHMVKDKI